MGDWLARNVSGEMVMLALGSIWYFFKGKKDGYRLDQLPTMLIGELRQYYEKFMSDPTKRASAESEMERVAWELLSRIKIPKNAITRDIVSSVVKKALAEVDREMANRALLQTQFDKMWEKVDELDKYLKTIPS